MSTERKEQLGAELVIRVAPPIQMDRKSPGKTTRYGEDSERAVFRSVLPWNGHWKRAFDLFNFV